jgi:hypothetical protein
MANGTEIAPPAPHGQYDPTTRVCTVFLSTLIGFGLNQLLQQQRPAPIAADRWPCFILASYETLHPRIFCTVAFAIRSSR